MSKRLSSIRASIARSTTALALAAAAFGAAPAFAGVWSEIGDAGQSLGTVQVTSNSQGSNVALTNIYGNLNSGTDADLFLINIFNPAAFSATTVGTAGFGDTQLFLLSAFGQAFYLNDDADGSTFFSTLPGGSAFGPLSAGLYILGVANGAYDPTNNVGDLLFNGGLFTEVRGPAGPLQPDTLGGFADNTFGFGSPGDYTIALTGAGAAVPEPASMLLVAMAGAACALTTRRRRTSSAPAPIVAV